MEPSDKAYYKSKVIIHNISNLVQITKHRSNYEATRKKFFKCEDSVKDQLNRQNLYSNTSINVISQKC